VGRSKGQSGVSGSSGRREKIVVTDVEDFLDRRFVCGLTRDKILEIDVEISFVVDFR